ncbi:hypothetical protein [Xanthomonas sacchari]|uniref:hypothetical protein n=1 Tax=Xanthomonas sacchari TaxID=56458 RepID=UPI002250EFD5|nr:hypothetical protein [Xanthomonas sacchari]
MKKISAKIDYEKMQKRNSVRHFRLDDSMHGRLEDLPDPVSLTIVEDDGGFFLLRIDEKGNCISDTWHIDLDDAKSQASFEFSVKDADWHDCDRG